MAGVKQFERSEVLDRAMALFWQRGYEATSIRDLVEATGINRGSIYGTFGDKQGLFLAVLDHYAEKIAKPMMTELSDPDPRRAVERMLDSIIRRAGDPGFPRGCLNTNTSLECPATGEEITRKIAAGFGQQETAIYRVLQRPRSKVCSIASLDLRALARFFMAVCHGMNVVNKALPDPGDPARCVAGRDDRMGCDERTARTRSETAPAHPPASGLAPPHFAAPEIRHAQTQVCRRHQRRQRVLRERVSCTQNVARENVGRDRGREGGSALESRKGD